MILVRTIFQAKWGKAGEVVTHLSESLRRVAEVQQARAMLLTHLSGEFNTVVLETPHESLTEWEQARARMFFSPELRESNARLEALIVSGRQEYYTIEAEQ